MSLRRIFSTNGLVKLICSLPVVLIVLYFLPALGVIIVIARYFIYGERHFFRTPVVLMLVGLILLAPRGLQLAIENFNLSFTIPFLLDILNLELYPKLADYGQFILIVGVVILIVSYLLKSFISGLSNNIRSMMSQYASTKQAEEVEIRKENDLKLREKEITSKQKTPHVVKCPHCGKTNSITGTVGKCKSCRSAIEYKGK
jgi:hypothetical protein